MNNGLTTKPLPHDQTVQPPQRGGRRIAWIVTMVFAVLILIPSMLGFVMKFMELVNLTQGDTDGGFAVTPVVNYLLASAGFFFLLLWAAVNGMFNDLEQPKYLMLENEQRLDRVPATPVREHQKSEPGDHSGS